jgi:HAD superfamily hydrolase (TIGR01509 family)
VKTSPPLDLDPALVADVDLLCLDAGNTVIFLDHARLARLCAREGWLVSPAALERAEGAAKVAIERGEGLDLRWSDAGVLGKRAWAMVVATMLARAGLATGAVEGFVQTLWSEHRARNLWSLVPDGLTQAVARARDRGVQVAIISNSEGMLEAILADLGILQAFDWVVDSSLVGVEKPDPRIFRFALDRAGVTAARALHLGDTYATDVVGARAAGLRVGLVDVYDHFAGRHLDVPRVASVAQVADAIVAARR